MKSLLRFTATLSLLGITTLTAWLGTLSQVLALPTEDIIKILQGIPVFTIVDGQGAPLVAQTDNKQRVTGIFISRKEADSFFQNLKKQNPEVASKVTVQPVSLGEVFKLAQANANKPDALSFAYVPISGEVQNAQKMGGAEYKGGVPLFVAKGGKDNTYLTIQQNNEQVIPFFFEAEQIQEMVEQFKKQQPAQASTVVIEVIPLENVLETLESSNDQALKQIRLVPTEESIQFMRSMASQQPAKQMCWV